MAATSGKDETIAVAAPSFNAKDTMRSKHEKFKSYSGDLRSYLNASLAPSCNITGAKAKATGKHYKLWLDVLPC